MINKVNIGLLAFIFLMISLIAYLPSYQPFSPFNPGWDGLSSIYKNSSGIVSNPSQLKNLEGCLVIPQPETMPNKQEIRYMKGFLERGNTIFIAGKGPIVNSMLRGLGSSIYTYNATVLDRVFHYRSKLFPIAFTSNSTKIVLFSTSYLENGVALANTSFLSYVNDSGVKYGPFSVASQQRIGKGKIIVVSDSYFLTNYLMRFKGNLAFFKGLADGRYYLATFLLPQSPQYRAKLFILKVSRLFALPYVQVLVIAALFLVSALIYGVQETAKLNYPEITEMLREHPDWDESIIKRIIEEKKGET